MQFPPSRLKFKPNLSQDFGDSEFRRTHQTYVQLMLSIDPYASSVKLTLCNTPEEQEQSKLLIAELMTNEVAAAKIESFSIKYSCDIENGRVCRCGDLLGPFVGLIDRGGGYLKALKHAKWVSFCVACSRRF